MGGDMFFWAPHRGGTKRAWCGFELEEAGRGWKRLREPDILFCLEQWDTKQGTADFQCGRVEEKGMEERDRTNWEHKYDELETF